MHKSWGNAIDFDEAAERMGVDVMRWMFAKARPEDNILLRLARRGRGAPRAAGPVERLRVLRRPTRGSPAGRPALARAGRSPSGGALDRWILSRAAGTAAVVEDRLRDVDAVGATRALSRVHGRPLDLVPAPVARADLALGRRGATARRRSRRSTRRSSATTRMLAPILPFLTDAMYQNLVDRRRRTRPDSVHLTALARRPTSPAHRDARLEAAMAGRAGRRRPGPDAAQHGAAQDPPAARPAWLALPDRGLAVGRRAAALVADEINVKAVEVIADDSDLVERRVKPLLPKIGKRLGCGDPGRDGGGPRRRRDLRRRRLGHARRRHAGPRRGRDPGDAAARARRSPTTTAWSSSSTRS